MWPTWFLPERLFSGKGMLMSPQQIISLVDGLRRSKVTSGLAILLATTVALGSAAADEPTPDESAREMMQPAEEGIKRGLAYLASRQKEDGTYQSNQMARNPAIIGLGGMAYLSSGSTPGRGPYGENLTRSVDYLLESTRPDGFIVASDGMSHGPMYGHGFATLFLAEVYGMAPQSELRDSLARSIELIVRSQNSEGGWRYNPEPVDADLSVTICQIMALRAARNAGLHVPNETVEACEEYVKKCQEPDGGFSYTLHNRSSMFPRSAAGVVSLYSAGVYEGPEIENGLKYLDKFLPRPGQMTREAHYFYGQYYAVQAMWHAGGERWQKWYPAIRDSLLESQRPDGSWQDSVSSEYATAMALIILQMPNNTLPIFQR